MADKQAELQARYGESEQGHFRIVDTLGIPHPYCISAKHVEVASDQFMGRLGHEAIEAAEKQGAKCGMRGCRLTYAEHEQGLVVECDVPMKGDDDKADPELHAYLLKCKPLAEADKYAGFAFVKSDKHK